MSLIDRLSGRKPGANGAAAPTPAPAEAPKTTAAPQAQAPAQSMPLPTAAPQASQRLASSMYTRQKGNEDKLSVVDQLKIDLHHRLIERLDLEALEQIKDENEVVHQILENATWAPNHGQTEPWKFLVFTEDGLKRLAAFQSSLYKEEAGDKFKEATFESLSMNPLKASHVIALCMKRDPNKKFPEVEEISAVACAVQNIYLTVTAYGLGGYWTTGGVTYKESAKSFFGLGEDDRLMGFFYLGHIAVPSPAGKRKPVSEKVEWVR